MDKLHLGIAGSLAIAVAVGVGLWLYAPGAPQGAAAAVAEACANVAATESYDMRVVTSSGTDAKLIADVEVQGSRLRWSSRFEIQGVVGPAMEEIYDGRGKRYSRSDFEPEWKVKDIGDATFGFPYTRESLCPDLSDSRIALQGQETIQGQQTRRYSIDTNGYDYIFWVDSDGWLMRAELVKGDVNDVQAQSDDGTKQTATLTGRGEPNVIEIPSQ